MTSFTRSALTDFDFGIPVYAGATVTAFTVDTFGNKTAFLATLYEDLTSAATLSNPQTLDGFGKWVQPIYINAPVILTVTGANGVPDHQTGVISANLAGDAATEAAASAASSQASFGMVADLFSKVRSLYNKVKAQGLPGSLVALSMLRVNAAATAYELRTTAQVRGDLGLPTAIGTNSYLKSNGGGTAYAEQSIATVRGDVGLPAIAAASAGYGVFFDATGTNLVGGGQIAGLKNAVIGGDFSVNPWQRGTSFSGTTSKQYTADRFWAFRSTGIGSGFGVSQVATSDPAFPLALRIQRTAGDASTNAINLATDLESVNSKRFQGKTVTLALRARKGANFSGTGTLSIIYGTGTDQSISSGYTGQTSLGGIDLTTLTTSFANYTFSAAVPASATQLGISYTHNPSGTAGAADQIDIEMVQLEEGPAFTGFERLTAGVTLRECQRYLPAFNAAGSSSLVGAGMAISGTAGYAFVTFPQARVAPTGVTVSSGAHFAAVKSDGSTVATTAVTFGSASATGCVVNFTVAAGLTAGNGSALFYNNASAQILFTGCEL